MSAQYPSVNDSAFDLLKKIANNSYEISLTLTVPVAADKGGTGFASYAIGDLLYADSASTLARLAIGAAGKVLYSNGAGLAPSWENVSSDTYWVADAPGIKYTAGPVSLNGTPTGDAGDFQCEDLTATGNLTVSGVVSGVLTSSGSGYTNSGFKITSTSAAQTWGLFVSDDDLFRIRDVTAAADILTLAPNGNIASTGNIALSGTGSQTIGGVGSRLVLQGGTADTPASAAAAGTAGSVVWDASYIYVCTATNTWKRAAIATW